MSDVRQLRSAAQSVSLHSARELLFERLRAEGVSEELLDAFELLGVFLVDSRFEERDYLDFERAVRARLAG